MPEGGWNCREVGGVDGQGPHWVPPVWAPSTLKGTHGASYAPTGQLQPPNLAVGFCLQIPSHPKELNPALRRARHTHTLAHSAGGTEDKEGVEGPGKHGGGVREDTTPHGTSRTALPGCTSILRGPHDLHVHSPSPSSCCSLCARTPSVCLPAMHSPWKTQPVRRYPG